MQVHEIRLAASATTANATAATRAVAGVRVHIGNGTSVFKSLDELAHTGENIALPTDELHFRSRLEPQLKVVLILAEKRTRFEDFLPTAVHSGRTRPIYCTR